MNTTTRLFLAGLLTAASVVVGAAPRSRPYSVLALGDVHFDRLDHHDLDWVEKEYGAGDVRQIRNYSKVTETVLPKLFQEVKRAVRTSRPPAAFVVQLGDFMEGLCGSPELARLQCTDAVKFVEQAELGVPFLVTKGNHDITGPGMDVAYDEVIVPFLGRALKRKLKSASFVVEREGAVFIFMDAYSRDALTFLERSLKARRGRQAFVLLHPPVVPFNARSTWHLYARERQKAEREKLIGLLGAHRAIVLSAHLHEYGVVVRKTKRGRFLQLSLNSVVRRVDGSDPSLLEGVEHYGPDLVKLEPRFSPGTEADRRASLEAEAPHILYFEHAKQAGYARLVIDGRRTVAEVFNGLGRKPWRTLVLSELLEKP